MTEEDIKRGNEEWLKPPPSPRSRAAAAAEALGAAAEALGTAAKALGTAAELADARLDSVPAAGCSPVGWSSVSRSS